MLALTPYHGSAFYGNASRHAITFFGDGRGASLAHRAVTTTQNGCGSGEAREALPDLHLSVSLNFHQHLLHPLRVDEHPLGVFVLGICGHLRFCSWLVYTIIVWHLYVNHSD